jgi:hypothetical protein
MPWTDSSPTSRIFVQAVLNPLTGRVNQATSPTGYDTTSGGSGGLLADSVKVALFNNSVSPDASAAVGSTGYNTGTWTTGNEVTDTGGGGHWSAGGLALGTRTYSILTAGSQTTASAVCFDAPDLAGSGNVTITNAYGCLVYDSTISAGTVAKQGMCFNYFGGAQSVTAGTFTVVWDATGVFKITN